MPSSYSPLLRLELMAVGEKNNAWGNATNLNLGTLLEKGVAGFAVLDVTSSDVMLTAVNGADDQARCAILRVIGSAGTARNIVAPSMSKSYVVHNGSNAVVTLKGAGTAGASVAAGEAALLIWNGTDFVRTSAAFSTLAAKASTLAQSGGDGAAMTFDWHAQPATPSYVWGSNDGLLVQPYAPSNFSVNSAINAGLATKASTLAQNGGNGTAMTFSFTNPGGSPLYVWGVDAGGVAVKVYTTTSLAVGYAGQLTNPAYNGYGVRTVSTSAPSGGADGDMHYQY